MNRKALMLLICTGAIVAAPILVSALAQTPQGSPPQATPTEQQQPAVTVPAEAKQVFERAVQAYKELTTYQDELVRQMDAELAEGVGKEHDVVGESEPEHVSLAFERPDHIALDSNDFNLFTNGETLWMVVDAMNQYTEAPAPEDVADVLRGMGGGLYSSHPVLSLLARPGAPITEVYDELRSVGEVKAETRDGVAGKRVTGTMNLPAPGFDAPTPVSLWFRDDTGMLGQVRVELADGINSMVKQMAAMGQAPPDMPEGPIYQTAAMMIEISNIKVGETISPQRFVYEPAEGVNKVTSFDPRAAAAGQQQALIGQEAPQFTGQTLAGDELSLADLRGKVVVLDFWATWCAPCVQALPLVQKVHEHFADQPVTILGINSDQPGMDSRVKAFVKERNLTFGHVMDAKGEINKQYHITGIPCTVIIDREGVVRKIHTGFSPKLEQELTKEIEELLAGAS